ncbi:hypothetical protein YC2023_047386 [Brassica napus]
MYSVTGFNVVTRSNQKFKALCLISLTFSEIKLQHFYNELVEYKLILDKAGDFLLQPEVLPLNREQSVGPTKQVKLGFLIGLVPRESLWC